MGNIRHETGWERGKPKIRHILGKKQQREALIKAQVEREIEPEFEESLKKADAVSYVAGYGVPEPTLTAALNAGQVPRSAKQGSRWHISPSGLDEWLRSIGITP